LQVRRILARQSALYATITNKRSTEEAFWVIKKPRGLGVPLQSPITVGEVLRDDPEYK
jgi:hypothetical protein